MSLNFWPRLSNLLSEAAPHRGKFFLDVLKTFIGVLLAFWAGEWQASREAAKKEAHLLLEVEHEVALNLTDLRLNLKGHQMGLAAAESFLKMMDGAEDPGDSLGYHFHVLLRGFISIQHTAAYETMKARGLESIAQDSLRNHISDLYDFEFETIEKLEEGYPPNQFFTTYYQPMIGILAQCYDFSKKKGEPRYILPLSKLPHRDKSLLAAWLKNIKSDRHFMIINYGGIIQKGEKVLAEVRAATGG